MSMRIGGFVHVPDASRDSRFADSPWVDGRRADVRFYAAAPLVAASGSVLGTLCVFDVQAHELDGDQREQLTTSPTGWSRSSPSGRPPPGSDAPPASGPSRRRLVTGTAGTGRSWRRARSAATTTG